jgi:hypothetical protein
MPSGLLIIEGRKDNVKTQRLLALMEVKGKTAKKRKNFPKTSWQVHKIKRTNCEDNCSQRSKR